MAKKNKKATKTNIKIRNFFGSDPFDVGISRVDERVLIELSQAIGLYDIELKKANLVRALRQLYSTANLSIRSDILAFFIANKKIYPSILPKEQTFEKKQILISLFEEFSDMTSDERAELFTIFLNIRTRKITYAKVESKLKYLRFEKKKADIAKRLDGAFNLDDMFEFNASLHVKYCNHNFKKIVVLKTKILNLDELYQGSDEEIIQNISKLKSLKSLKSQLEINTFLKKLKQPHPYLNINEIVKILKQALPTDDLKLPLISKEVLKNILSREAEIFDVLVTKDEILISVDTMFYLLNKEIKHKIYISINLSKLLKKIYDGEKLNILVDIRKTKREQEKYFIEQLDNLVAQCINNASLLKWNQDEVKEKVQQILFDYLHDSLDITPKIERKVIYSFNKSIQQQLQKKQRQVLLARTIREFKDLFAVARNLKRELIFHVGPTNSGKTYQAMQMLKKADTGYYLAPLRLLALEGYENLIAHDLQASLITGEEQILNEEATHISSTIEMLNFDVDVDVCVIDEVQMIEDRNRGWAWANAIIGAPAKKIIMTGSPNALKAIKELARYLDEKLTIVEFKRKNPLKLLKTATATSKIKTGSAIVAFSRKDVLQLKQKFSKNYKVSVIYGNLSPEVRREEARRFREKETDILIATDAIAMGLNLPIKTIFFSAITKFDGQSNRLLSPLEIQQIAGRAGRYGMHEIGYIGAFTDDCLKIIDKELNATTKDIQVPFKVMANLDHIKLVGSILDEKSLTEILKFFATNMKFNGPFYVNNIEEMLEAAKIVDEYNLDITTKYQLACAPLTLKSPYIITSFKRYISKIEQKSPIFYTSPQIIDKYALSIHDLLKVEDRVKEITLYLWLSYRFEQYFIDTKNAKYFRDVLNRYIEKSLRRNHFISLCKICKKALPTNLKYTICQKCFHKKQKRR